MATKEERNARARDNQRLSRARRLDYIAALEGKVREYEKTGAHANRELQLSARFVEKQNALLRAWVCRTTQLREPELADWLGLPAEQADQHFNAFLASSGRYISNPQDRYPPYSQMGTENMGPPLSASLSAPVSAPLSAPLSYASESSFSDSSHTGQAQYYDAQAASIAYHVNGMSQYLPLRRNTAPNFQQRTSSDSPVVANHPLVVARHDYQHNTDTPRYPASITYAGVYDDGLPGEGYVHKDSAHYLDDQQRPTSRYLNPGSNYQQPNVAGYNRAYISESEISPVLVPSQALRSATPRLAEVGSGHLNGGSSLR